MHVPRAPPPHESRAPESTVVRVAGPGAGCRDLKPENILLSDKSPHAVLKVIDFGTSDFCLDGQRLTQKFGTPYYVAPEVRGVALDAGAGGLGGSGSSRLKTPVEVALHHACMRAMRLSRM